MNDEAIWFLEFVIGVLGEDANRKITEAAYKRMNEIVQLIAKNPAGPSTIAERVLEQYLEEYAEAQQ